MTVKTHKRLEELRVLLNYEEHNVLFAMFSNGYKQAEQDLKPSLDRLTKALEYYATPSTHSERNNPYPNDYDFCKGGPASNAQSGATARKALEEDK